MRFHNSLLAIAALWTISIEAHSMITTLYVNGESVGDGTCLRLSNDASTVFIPDIKSDEMSCGITGMQKVDRTCPIKAGDTVSFRWSSRPGSDKPDVIAASHSGTCGVYMKQISTGEPSSDGSFPDDSPAGDGWFRVLYDDQDSSGSWCTDRLRNVPNGILSVQIPSDVKPGYYLIRPELLTLQLARHGNPQFYVGCAQVYISGGSGTANPETVSIPGYVDMSMPAMNFNIHDPKAGQFPGFGPAVYKAPTNAVSKPVASKIAAAAPSTLSTVVTTAPMPTYSTIKLPSGTANAAQAFTTAAAAPASPSPEPEPPCSGNEDKREVEVANKIESRQSVTDVFACPKNTIYEVGNMCLPEVPAWNDTDDSMKNCWASSKKCWDTNQHCWDKMSSAVNYHSGHGCYLYEYRCRAIQRQCERKVKQGPPDAGAILTPEKATIGGYGIVM